MKERSHAAYTLFSSLKKAEERAERERWIDADDLEKELGIAAIQVEQDKI